MLWRSLLVMNSGCLLFGFTTGRIIYPVYVRGEAYLAAHRGSEAAAEFQKILDIEGLCSTALRRAGALAIGRAYALQGDRGKARAAYQIFLRVEDADPDIPISGSQDRVREAQSSGSEG